MIIPFNLAKHVSVIIVRCVDLNYIFYLKIGDQLIRHQPSLRVPGLNAIVRALEQLAKFGKADQYVIMKESFVRNGHTLSFRPTEVKKDPSDSREQVPLLDYITNIVCLYAV